MNVTTEIACYPDADNGAFRETIKNEASNRLAQPHNEARRIAVNVAKLPEILKYAK